MAAPLVVSCPLLVVGRSDTFVRDREKRMPAASRRSPFYWQLATDHWQLFSQSRRHRAGDDRDDRVADGPDLSAAVKPAGDDDDRLPDVLGVVADRRLGAGGLALVAPLLQVRRRRLVLRRHDPRKNLVPRVAGRAGALVGRQLVLDPPRRRGSVVREKRRK